MQNKDEPAKKPTGFRDVRCPHCGWFLAKVRATRWKSGSMIAIEVGLHCRNRRCRHEVFFDLEFDDTPH